MQGRSIPCLRLIEGGMIAQSTDWQLHRQLHSGSPNPHDSRRPLSPSTLLLMVRDSTCFSTLFRTEVTQELVQDASVAQRFDVSLKANPSMVRMQAELTSVADRADQVP